MKDMNQGKWVGLIGILSIITSCIITAIITIPSLKVIEPLFYILMLIFASFFFGRIYENGVNRIESIKNKFFLNEKRN